MVDLAVGLSKKVVDGLVKKVEDAIKEERELWQIVEQDSVLIKDEFEMMKSFLKTADRDRVRNNVVRTWVRQVRDLSYDAEDCMDGVLELEPKRPWWALSFWPRMLPTCCRPRVGRALDEAVDKIKLIKARVEEVSHRNLRYNLINTTGSGRMQHVAATAMDMDLDLVKVHEGSSRLRWLLYYEAFHGRLNVISVWGTGGNLGAIPIIRSAFDHPNVCQVHKCRAWVKLMHPFSPQKFLGDLVAQLLTNSGATYGADIWSRMGASPVDLAKEVEQLLKGRSYLIVLEDLSNMEELYTIRTYLPDDDNGSQQVIVSTQHRQIARLCIGQPQYVQELSQLSADDCVYAFFEETRMPSEHNQGSTDVAAFLSAAANYWRYLPPIIGRDEEARQLSDLISSPERDPNNDTYSYVVTVLGPSNIGKDAVVAKVCSQLLLSSSSRFGLFELYGWVNVSNTFNVRGVCQSLLSVLQPKSPYYFTDPVGECSRLLSEHRCLIVIYGMQRTEDCTTLETAGLIYNHPGSCIVVVTTEESVATYWTEATSAAVCKIEPIAADESLSGQQGQLVQPTIAGSIGGPPSELKDFADYWYNHCLSGCDEELSQLYDMISSSLGSHQNIIDRTRVLTIWGPPNVGTDTLVGLVGKVCSHYVRTDPSRFQLYGWVDVSSNSNPEVSLEGFFSQSLLSCWLPHVPDFATEDDTDPVQNCLINVLTNNRCLVVIGGLQSMEDCHKLINARLIYGHPNSCIILITEEESVATFWKQTSSPYAVCNVRKGQPPTPRKILDDINHLFFMANGCFPKYSTIIGREDEVERLSSMIISSSPSTGQNGTRVIVIWGPPGVGKTALVEKVYSQIVLNRRLTAQPFVRCGWVQVSNPFNLRVFSRSLLSVLRPESPQSPDPVRDCSNLVQSDPCLVVIDGLQSMENFWELVSFGFIYGHPNSCIVLITTEKSVNTCMQSLVPHDALLQVKPLDGVSATELFRQQEYGQERSFLLNCDLVADKCCGLPLVILAVAKYLRRSSDDQVTQFMAAVKDGKFIHELATNTQLEFVGLKGLLAWVDSELKACPEPLKLLIMYMFNFSEETVIRGKRLVRRWIAEGYIKNTGICDMVTEAEKHVLELQDLTMMMMQVAPGGRKNWHRGYQLRGFSGEVLMSRAAEDPLFLPLEVSALTEGKRSLTSRGCAGRHLRIDDKWERSEFVFHSLDLSRLRSLTVSGRFMAFFINDSMRVLRVLDLEDARGVKNDDLKKILKVLTRLRFLSLRGCEEINFLPKSIGDLKQLQTLDIRRTSIAELPNSILKLRNLQCLRAGHNMKQRVEPDERDTYTPWRKISSRLRGLASCSWRTREHMVGGVTMPTGFSSQLKSLHTLGIVNVNTAGGEAILEELPHFMDRQLRKLELYGINSYNIRGLRHLPRILNTLDSLSLWFTKDRDATSTSFKDGLFGLDRVSERFRLKLHGHVGILEVLPDGIKVTDLTLEIDTSLTEDNMKRIGKLPSLHTLRLHFHRECEDGKLKFDANDGFLKLEVLEITSWDAVLDVEFAPGPGAVGTLNVLKFVGFHRIPLDGLHALLSLNEVWIADPQLLRIMRRELEGHPNKPAVIDFGSWIQIF